MAKRLKTITAGRLDVYKRQDWGFLHPDSWTEGEGGAVCVDGDRTVSYTHLDVYKRQRLYGPFAVIDIVAVLRSECPYNF